MVSTCFKILHYYENMPIIIYRFKMVIEQYRYYKLIENVFIYTDTRCFNALHFIVLCRHCVFLQIESFGHPALSTASPVLFSLCHILVILAINLFIIITFAGNLWSVVLDITIEVVLGHYDPLPYKINLIVKCCVCSDCSTDRHPCLCLFPSPQVLFPETQRYWNQVN